MRFDRFHCQSGHSDLCLLARYCEITCPPDSCDIDDGLVDWPEPPPGPFNVEIWEVPGCWDSLLVADDYVQAARIASKVVKRDWRVHGHEARVRILDARGAEC